MAWAGMNMSQSDDDDDYEYNIADEDLSEQHYTLPENFPWTLRCHSNDIKVITEQSKKKHSKF